MSDLAAVKIESPKPRTTQKEKMMVKPAKESWHRRALSKATEIANAATNTNAKRIAGATTLGVTTLFTPVGQEAAQTIQNGIGDLAAHVLPAETSGVPVAPEISRNQMVNSILRDAQDTPYTEAFFNPSGNVIINFEKMRNSTVPFIRTSPDADDSNPENYFNRFMDLDSVAAVNGIAINGIKQGLTLSIDNYTFVVKTDITDSSKTKWIALNFTLTDGSNRIFYINDGPKTSGLVSDSGLGQSEELNLISEKQIPTVNSTVAVQK